MPPPARAHQTRDTAARTDEFNAAAEAYFARLKEYEYLLHKPYSDPFQFSRYLFNVGVLSHYLRVGPGDRVVEVGAGTCWVSHFLNRFGCRTVSIDVSLSALALGRDLFRRDGHTRWDLRPTFLPYDGHRLPLADASCDRIIIHDAYHHFPNPQELLGEMVRILRPQGIVAMSEPGREHSASEDSQREVEYAQVLENDVIIEDVDTAARAAGFTRVTLVPVVLEAPEVPAGDLEAFLHGKGFTEHWACQATQLLGHQFILLYKGEPRQTTRGKGRHRARLEPLGVPQPGILRAIPGAEIALTCRVHNVGESTWLAGPGRFPGEALLGVRLRPAATDTQLQDWARGLIPREMSPGEEAHIDLRFPAPDHPGRYQLVLDMVAESLCWFGDQGSEVAELTLEVGSLDTDPGLG